MQDETTPSFGIRRVKVLFDRHEHWRRRFSRLAMATLIGTPWIFGAALAASSQAITYVGLAGLAILIFSAIGLSAVTIDGGLRTQNRPAPRRKSGDLKVDAEALRFGERSFPRASLVQGWSIAKDDAVVLRLEGGTDMVIQPLEAQEAESLLRSLGLGVGRRAVRFPVGGAEATSRFRLLVMIALVCFLMPNGFGLGVGMGALAIVMSSGGGDATPELMVVMAVTLVIYLGFQMAIWQSIRFLRRQMVTVGTDGVAVEGFWRRKVYPYRDIDSVQTGQGRIMLSVRDRPMVEMVSVRGTSGLLWRIRAELEAFRDRQEEPPPPFSLEQLERRDRSESEWIAALRKLTGSGQGYRSASADPDGLAGLVEDPTLSPEQRVGAALAASFCGDEGIIDRIMTSARTTADQDLRMTLEYAARGRLDRHALKRVKARIRS
jgi:hypothetical protein